MRRRCKDEMEEDEASPTSWATAVHWASSSSSSLSSIRRTLRERRRHLKKRGARARRCTIPPTTNTREFLRPHFFLFPFLSFFLVQFKIESSKEWNGSAISPSRRGEELFELFTIPLGIFFSFCFVFWGRTITFYCRQARDIRRW